MRPMKNRTTQKPTPLYKLLANLTLFSNWSNEDSTHLVMAGMQMVPALHMSMTVGRKIRGFVLAKSMFPGSWPMRYPT